MTLTVLKTSFKRNPPRIVEFREYKKYSFHAFQTDMYYQLGNVDFRCLSNDDFHTFFMRLVDLHVPLKTFGRFFNNAVRNLNIKMHSKTFNNECLSNINPITEAIKKIKEHFSGNFNFSFKSVSNEEIQKEIRDLSETKSSPLDAIPARIIRDHKELFCQKIKIDFDTAIMTGIFPQNLKLADVTPVFKKMTSILRKTIVQLVSYLEFLKYLKD